MSINPNNLIPLTEETSLRPGQRVVKLGEYYFPIGFGESYSSSINFYKCISVDVSTKTWSGYKAILVDSSYYYFQENITEGLIYLGNAVEVDNIYSSDGLVQIANLFNGLLNNEEDENLTLVVNSNSTYNSQQNSLILTSGSVSDDGVLDVNN